MLERGLINLIHAVIKSLVNGWRLCLRHKAWRWVSAILNLLLIRFNTTVLHIHSFWLVLGRNKLRIALIWPFGVSLAAYRLNILTVVLIISSSVLTGCSLMINHLRVRGRNIWWRLWANVKVEFRIMSCLHRGWVLLWMHAHISWYWRLRCILRHHFVVLGCAGHQLATTPFLGASSIIRLLHRSLCVLNWFYFVS
jgi:hypothetical protein